MRAPRNHSQLMSEYLRKLGKDDNSKYDILSGELASAKTFDIVMFRGTDFVSGAITRVSRSHGSDFFSHCGIVIKPPLIPRGGHYLKSAGGIDVSNPHLTLT